jgi:pimeloyl-ACP methyl ester carboxylesterase
MLKPVSRVLPAALLAAFALAVSARAVAYRTRRAEHDHPPRGEFIEVDGVLLHYVARGSGQPLVLLHGSGAVNDGFELSGLVDLASQRYRVIVFDRPGYGSSERPRSTIWTPRAQAALLHKALQRLGAERPLVVGHSWGAQVALALALDYPAHVRSLVLLSGYYFPTFRLDVFLLSPPAIPVIGDVVRHAISPWLGRAMWPGILKMLFAPNPAPPRFARFPVWMALRPSQLRASAMESALMSPGAIALRRRYGELKVPTVIMAGANDRIVDAQRQSARLHQAIAHSELRLTPGAGHMIHYMVPVQVMAAIDAAAAKALR